MGVVAEPHPAKMMFFLVVFLIPFCCNAQTFETYPVQNEGEEKIIVEANVGDTNVSIYCRVTSDNIQTTWEVNEVALDFDAVTGESVTDNYTFFSILVTLPSLRANLSINSFMLDHDRLKVVCRTGDPDGAREIFLFGIPGIYLKNTTSHILILKYFF